MKTPAALVIASVAALLPALPAAAEEPVDAVKAFYDHPGLELEPTARDRFVDPARRILDQNDAIKAGGEPDGCLDPALPFNDTDYDLAEVTGSLKLAQSVTGDEAKVVAMFKAEGAMARVEWQLKKVGDAWKVADIVSMTKDWALSQFNCE